MIDFKVRCFVCGARVDLDAEGRLTEHKLPGFRVICSGSFKKAR